MAAIGKIREQSTLLLIVIGGAMIAFVLGDLFSNNPASQQQFVGEVYGEEIDMQEYEQRVLAEKDSRNSVGQVMNSNIEDQIRNQVWNQMVQEKIMYTELNKLGMRIGQEEFDDVRFGENIAPEFLNDPTFQNPETGQFDPEGVQRYFVFIQQQYPAFYENLTNRVVNNRLYEKYNNLVQKGVYVNTLEAKNQYHKTSERVDFDFVLKRYNSVPDSSVTVSESELKSYFDKHKDEDKYDLPATVSLSYVALDVVASEEDEESIKEELRSLIADFESTSNDSLFIMRNSDRSNTAAVIFQETNTEIDTEVEKADSGTVVGPYKSNGFYKIGKVVGSEREEQAKARHILLRADNPVQKEELKIKADSIVRVIKQNDNFEEMVTLFSEDPGSKNNGGEYDWFNRETMVAEFTEASFDKPKGSLNVVATDYGVHIVEPLDVRERKLVKVVEVDRFIEPSSSTFDEVYDEASDLSINAGNAKEFKALAEEKGYTVQPANNIDLSARSLPGIPGSRDLVSWAHDADNTDIGDISEPFEFGNNIVVAVLESRRDEGRAEMADVVDQIKPEVIREKKAEMFKNDMTGTDLAQIAEANNLAVQAAANVSGNNPVLPGGLNEPFVVGKAMTLEEGETTSPLIGKAGVYVVQLKAKVVPAERDEFITYKEELTERNEQRFANINSAVYSALRDFAGVEDNRAKFY